MSRRSPDPFSSVLKLLGTIVRASSGRVFKPTLRPQNRCKTCGYTWFPRGKSISIACPRCHGPVSQLRSIGCGTILLALGSLFVVGTCVTSDHHQPVADTNPAATPKPVQRLPPAEKRERPVISDERRRRAAELTWEDLSHMHRSSMIREERARFVELSKLRAVDAGSIEAATPAR